MKATLERLRKECDKEKGRYDEIRARQKEIASQAEFWNLGTETQMEYDRLWKEADKARNRATKIQQAIQGIEYAMQIIKELENE